MFRAGAPPALADPNPATSDPLPMTSGSRGSAPGDVIQARLGPSSCSRCRRGHRWPRPVPAYRAEIRRYRRLRPAPGWSPLTGGSRSRGATASWSAARRSRPGARNMHSDGSPVCGRPRRPWPPALRRRRAGPPAGSDADPPSPIDSWLRAPTAWQTSLRCPHPPLYRRFGFSPVARDPVPAGRPARRPSWPGCCSTATAVDACILSAGSRLDRR